MAASAPSSTPSADGRRVGALPAALAQDVRFALRTLRRSPGYAIAVVGVLALGIGANVAMFSVIHGVLLAPLPFRDGEELILVRQSAPGSGIADAGVSIPELADYRARLRTVRDLVEYHTMSFTLLERGEPDRVSTGVVSANFFDVLGVQPALGRGFVDADDDHGAEAVLLLAHDYWRRKFAGDARVIGQVVQMNDRPHTIVGVLPDFPQYPNENDVYMPSSACPFRDQAGQTLAGGHRTFAALSVFGRLAGGATPQGASTEVAAVAAAFPREHPADYQRARELAGRAEVLEETLVEGARPMLLALSGATLLVLLIACANVANLSIGRTTRRARELAVRSAVGAGRGRLFAQMLTESVIVALAGGAAGVLVAWVGHRLLVGFVERFTTRTAQIALDGRVLGFALVASLVTGIVVGTAPALAARRSVSGAVRDDARGSSSGPGRRRFRTGLVVAQVAFSFVLLVGAGLLLRSFHRLSQVQLGYDGRQVMTASFFGNFTSLGPSDTLRIHDDILERLRASPGVVAAALTSAVPLSNIQPGVVTIRLEGGPGGSEPELQIDPNVASDGYFETLGVPLLAGRTFRESDTQDAPSVAVVNASLARAWPGGNALGSRFRFDGAQPPPGRDPWVTVVGVVADFQLYQPDLDVPPQVYLPYQQTGGFAGRVLARAAADPLALADTIERAIHSVDPKSPVEDLQTIAELRRGHLASPQLTAVLLTAFAAVALLVTLSGIAGVVAASVTERTRELGVRMALGASRGAVLRMVLGQGVTMVVVGLALGVGGAYAFGRLLGRFLYATEPTDPLAYGLVAAVFVTATLLATFAPARRATGVEPLIAFKSE